MVTVTPFSAALGSWGRERTISLCLFITTPMILSCSAVLQKRDLLACLPPLTYCAQMTKAVDDRTAPTTLCCCCPSHFSVCSEDTCSAKRGFRLVQNSLF